MADNEGMQRMERIRQQADARLPGTPVVAPAAWVAGVRRIAGQGAAVAAVVAATLSVAAPAPAGAQEVKGDPKAAEQKIAMCIGCHAIGGYKASFPSVYQVPMIKGQTAKYIENALIAYRSGDRNHPTMRAIAGSLSDQDIADLAAYYGKSEAK
jgi:cytochrome c553